MGTIPGYVGGDGRFAPSPSGPLHVGNLRTALLAWCFARHNPRARFLVRVEDLDPARSRREHERGQLEDLRALGLDWDEDPPVRQSERTGLYREAFQRLERDDAVYPCWCTRKEIREAASAPHRGAGAYPGTCRRLSARERAAKERSGRPTAWRLDARRQPVTFIDALHGEQHGTPDDFVVWRGDGVAAYNLAVVVDDAEQRIEQVVRGDDLLEGTPRQVLLAERLGLKAPRYAHVPLVLGPDGRRLAKRHGAVTLADLRAKDVTIEQILAWMAHTSALSAADEPYTPPLALATRLDPDRLSREPTVFAPIA
ncbi:MAG TPA: tRNA glutamyl-Q(34) synthetase GluQRS [Solirubrobacteraceae bacterium]|nr:tRNA glutamyl-Q(34) synthetase GluQRS [Solirubrobacteraceae bacterium]